MQPLSEQGICSSGVRDTSGLRFLVTSNLRPHDAGIMELGLIYTDRMAIPPGQFMYPLNGFCLPACTAVVSSSPVMQIFRQNENLQLDRPLLWKALFNRFGKQEQDS